MQNGLIFSILWLLIGLSTVADAVDEQVSNVQVEFSGAQVIVLYDLAGKGDYAVSLHVSEDLGRTFSESLLSVSGDVGSQVEPGTRNKIVWDCLEDRDALSGTGIVFQVRATQVRRGKVWPWIVGVGITGAAAGVAGMQLQKDKDSKGVVSISIPDPEP